MKLRLKRDKNRCCKDMTWQTRPGKEELRDSLADSFAALAVEFSREAFCPPRSLPQGPVLGVPVGEMGHCDIVVRDSNF